MPENERPRRKTQSAPRALPHALPGTRGRRPAAAPAAETAASVRVDGATLALALMRVSATIAGFDDKKKLNWYQWEALRFFTTTPPDGSGPRPKSAAAFARFVGITVTTATRTLRALESRGLLSFAAVPFDGTSLRGGYVITPTRAGLEIMADDPIFHIRHVLERELTATHRSALIETIQALVAAAAERRLRISPTKK